MHEDITITRDLRENQPFKITISGISHCDGTYKISRPKSRTYCFEYIYEGEGTVCLDGVPFYPKAGDVYWLPARHNQSYYSSESNPWKKIWFNVRGTFVSSILECYNMEHINHIKSFNSPELFEKFLNVAKSGDNYADITDKCSAIFLEIVQKLAEHTNSLANKTRTIHSVIALRLKNAIDRSHDFNLTMDKLANEQFCTKSHAIRVFKESYGITPYQYLLERKLHDAKLMLTDTAYSIKEISDFLCFNDPHYFSLFFKKETGMSPSEYRKSKKS